MSYTHVGEPSHCVVAFTSLDEGGQLSFLQLLIEAENEE